MAETEGKLLTCDLCGMDTFLKYLGDGESDGGFTKWRRYQKADGWGNVHVGKISYSTICPFCKKKIESALRTCISEIRGETDQDG